MVNMSSVKVTLDLLEPFVYKDHVYKCLVVLISDVPRKPYPWQLILLWRGFNMRV